MLDVVLAIGMPLFVTVLILYAVAVPLADAPSQAPERGTPERRRTSARIRNWGESLALGCFLTLMAELVVFGRFGDHAAVLWTYVAMGAGMGALGRLDLADS